MDLGADVICIQMLQKYGCDHIKVAKEGCFALWNLCREEKFETTIVNQGMCALYFFFLH